MPRHSSRYASKSLYIDGCRLKYHWVPLLPFLTSKCSARGAFDDITAAEQWTAEAMDPRQFKFIIEARELIPRKCLGVIGLNAHGSVGYQLDPTAWGQGYATEALKGYLPALFNHFHDLEEVTSNAFEGNAGSRRVLEKCGFVLDNQVPPGERRNMQNDENDVVAEESREEKIRELRTTLNGIGLQKSVNAPLVNGNRRLVLYRYDRPSLQENNAGV